MKRKSARIRTSLCVALLITMSAAKADDTPQLLFLMTSETDTRAVTSVPAPVAVAIAPTLSLDRFGDPATCIGCNARLPLNTRVTETITAAANPVAWQNFFAGLSDSTNSPFFQGFCLYTSAAMPPCSPSSGSGTSELQTFGSVGAFATRTVDFIDVTVFSTYTYMLGGPLGGSTASLSSRAYWQFWGTGEPIGNPHPPGVPEPGTLSLLALGLVGVGFMRRRKALVP